jgi:hypothetical protein
MTLTLLNKRTSGGGRKSRLVMMGLLTVGFITGGCAEHRPVFTTAVPAREMKKKELHNEARMAGIDSPRHLRDTYFGVDVTGQAPINAFIMVVQGIPSRVYKSFHQQTPANYLSEMEDVNNSDHRREGILNLVKYRFVRTNPIYSKRFDQIAKDPQADFSVRAAAIRAMNYSRSKVDRSTYVDALDDAQPEVRLEAAKALSNMPDELAAPKLIQHMQRDDNKDVRIASADALRNFKTPEVARALIGELSDRDFSVAFRARESLIFMTGRNFRFEEADWLNFFATAQKPFYP